MLDKLKVGIYKNKISKKLEELFNFDSRTSREIVEDFFSAMDRAVYIYAKNNNLSQEDARKKMFQLLQDDKDLKNLLEKNKLSS